MVRKKDILWGVYAALLPWVVIVLLGKAESLLEQYIIRTFDSGTAFLGVTVMALLYGIMLAVLAAHFLSKPVETSKIPMIGLYIGLAYCVVLCMYWPLSMFISREALYRFYMIVGEGYRTARTITVLGFYVVLAIIYMKTRTYISQEEPREMLKKENEQEEI